RLGGSGLVAHCGFPDRCDGAIISQYCAILLASLSRVFSNAQDRTEQRAQDAAGENRFPSAGPIRRIP
ncbi:MAG: hypothetical protein NT123_00270, partial [Proteobacteria bacterium]|nr:hypothetical protein [Pseudomonadota bacterium]